MARISIDTAKKILSDSPREQMFFSNDGRVIKNISEFAAYLHAIDTSTFKYHVNNDRNDYSKWILEVLGDTKLSRELLRIKSKETGHKKTIKRMEELRRLINTNNQNSQLKNSNN